MSPIITAASMKWSTAWSILLTLMRQLRYLCFNCDFSCAEENKAYNRSNETKVKSQPPYRTAMGFWRNLSGNELLPIITDAVIPGTTIVTNMWWAYNGILNIPERNLHIYEGITRKSACTNTVESMWNQGQDLFYCLLCFSIRFNKQNFFWLLKHCFFRSAGGESAQEPSNPNTWLR